MYYVIYRKIHYKYIKNGISNQKRKLILRIQSIFCINFYIFNLKEYIQR